MWEKVWNHEKIAYGGDYNPEQWPEETWEEDMRLLKLAHIDTLTLNVFSWAALQPSEEEYCFEKLDKIMELAKKHHMKQASSGSLGHGTTLVQIAWCTENILCSLPRSWQNDIKIMTI